MALIDPCDSDTGPPPLPYIVSCGRDCVTKSIQRQSPGFAMLIAPCRRCANRRVVRPRPGLRVWTGKKVCGQITEPDSWLLPGVGCSNSLLGIAAVSWCGSCWVLLYRESDLAGTLSFSPDTDLRLQAI